MTAPVSVRELFAGVDARIPETRCVHDMLTFHVLVDEYENGLSYMVAKSSCSICRGLPYTVNDPLAEFQAAVLAEDVRRPQVQWLPLEERAECTACERPLNRGQLAAWSQRLEGPVGTCCREEVE